MCVARRSGAIWPDAWEGVYHRDVRLVSRFALTVGGAEPARLAASRQGASAAERVHVLATDDRSSPTVLLRCRRSVDLVVREVWTVSVYGDGPFGGELRLRLESDFADLVARKHTLAPALPVPYRTGEGLLYADGERFGVQVEAVGPVPHVTDDALVWAVEAEPGRPWTAGVTFHPRDGGRALADPPRRARSQGGLLVETRTTGWEASIGSALADLEGLRVTLPDLGLSYIGAGAPWYMALFGRDSLLTGWSSLIAGTGLGLDVLEALARFQGERDDPETGEQPGRILHELRTGGAGVFGLRPGQAYYGTVDATPLFVMLLDELCRWGAAPDRARVLLPAARAAVDWCVERGDLDGDGYIEYAADAFGLVNQGWKDSPTSMVHADGTVARTPIALAEVQAYLYGALGALAALEERLGDPARAGPLRARATALRAAFRRDFWLPEAGLVAMALDAEKRPLAVASSNMTHCLWTGLLDDDVAERVAARAAGSDLSTAWGLRTLGSGERAYNPMSYHLGSVWPHDTAVAAAGLMRYGHAAPALRLVDGLLAAAEHFDWRLPELYGGFDVGEVAYPVPYPVACSPQAWSAAAPLLLLRTVLRLDPDVPRGRVTVAPVLPDDVALTVHLPLAGGTLSLRAHGTTTDVLTLPDGLDIVTNAK
jgi:glycogen debranching enzyme